MKDKITPAPKVTRVEVISAAGGREYVNMNCSDVKIAEQDGGKTIKMFLK